MLADRRTRTATLAVFFICFMSGLGWASIPLYRMFCQATGLNGTTQRGLAAPGGTGRRMQIDFDTNVAPHMPWKFVPENRSETIDIGARDMAFFTATNTSDKAVTGTATYNVTPAQAGKYFTKIQCFCFIFFVDPKILKDPDAADVQTITLSYTFYPVDSAKAKS